MSAKTKIKEVTQLNKTYYFKLSNREKRIKANILDYDEIYTKINLYCGSDAIKLMTTNKKCSYVFVIPYSIIESIQDEKKNTIYSI